MSEAELFVDLTALVDVDPFALLGISVSADERRIAKRYRTVAKQLHPDALANGSCRQEITPAMAAQVIARIVNPAYQKLKHDNSREEILAMLRLRVRRLARTQKLIPTFEHAQQLADVEESDIDVHYEQIISQLAKQQFVSTDQIRAYSLELAQLNLVYLSRKTVNTVIRQKRSGLISNAITPTAVGKTIGSTEPIPVGEPNEYREKNVLAPAPDLAVDYVAKHTERAKVYLKQRSYDSAVQELREALKISPQSAELHSMIGQAYYKQSLTGMAKAHFKRAYGLNPNHQVVKKYIKLLGLTAELKLQTAHTKAEQKVDRTATDSAASTDASSVQKKAWLGKLLRR